MHRPTIATLCVFAVIAAIPSVSTLVHAADSCQPIFDALTRVVTTPSHSYTTHTAAFLKGSKPQGSETISADGKVYIRVNGKGMVNPVGPKDILEQQRENREHSKATCQFVGNEFGGAEAAVVYSMRSENEGDKEDAQMWISKSAGLLLRSEQDGNVGGVAGKEHRSARFEYGNIRPPM